MKPRITILPVFLLFSVLVFFANVPAKDDQVLKSV